MKTNFRKIAAEKCLTPRERAVSVFAVRGYSYKKIAGELNISTRTVETHLMNLRKKFAVCSAYELQSALSVFFFTP